MSLRLRWCAPTQASMPIRHGGRLASRASTWPRDHFCRNTKAPRRSWPTRWNEFLPISMPMTAISLLSFWDMACSFALGAPRQFGPLAGLEHGRTIPLADIGGPNFCVARCSLLDHLVRRSQQRFRDGEAERLGGLQVDDHLDFCDLLHGEVGRLVAFENAPGIDTNFAVIITDAAAITHRAAG